MADKVWRSTLVQISFRGAAVLPYQQQRFMGTPNLRFVTPRGCDFIDFSREVKESNEFVLLCLSVHPI